MTNPLSVFGSLPLAIDAEMYDRPYGNQKPYAMENGIAVIDVSGALMKNASLFDQLFFGASSYEDITDQLELAAEDVDVQAILLRINSPGGTVSGMFQTARAIQSARQSKPVWAVADDLACSAAYMLASAAERIYVPAETGCVGSIGVIAQRLDVSEADRQAGVTLHLVHAGKQKPFGNPHTPMSSEEEARLQAEIDRMYGLFVDAVSRNRGISAAKLRATEAGLFTGQAAVDAKLADKTGTFEDALAALRKKNKRGSQGMNGHSMTAPAAMNTQVEEEIPMKEITDPTTPAATETTVSAAPETPITEAAAAVSEQAAAASELVIDPAVVAEVAEQSVPNDAAVEIADLCAIAGQPALAAGFISARKSAADVRAALLSARAASQESTQIKSQVTPANGVTKTNVEDNPVVKACVQIAVASVKGAKK